MLLYDYCRSTAAYRVRIALNLKGIKYAFQGVDLLAGEEVGVDYLARNPQGLVPALQLDDGTVLTQSLAICEYLEHVYPTPALLPDDPVKAAQVRAFAQSIACDIHPLNNLRVLKYLTGTLGVGDAAKLEWYSHWVAAGFRALEACLQTQAERNYCFGDEVTLADIFLVGQMFNAQRFHCDLTPYPRLVAITARCELIDAFNKAHPAHLNYAEPAVRGTSG